MAQAAEIVMGSSTEFTDGKGRKIDGRKIYGKRRKERRGSLTADARGSHGWDSGKIGLGVASEVAEIFAKEMSGCFRASLINEH